MEPRGAGAHFLASSPSVRTFSCSVDEWREGEAAAEAGANAESLVYWDSPRVRMVPVVPIGAQLFLVFVDNRCLLWDRARGDGDYLLRPVLGVFRGPRGTTIIGAAVIDKHVVFVDDRDCVWTFPMP